MCGRLSISSVYCETCNKHFANTTLKKRHDKEHHNGAAQPCSVMSTDDYLRRFGHLKLANGRVCQKCKRLFGTTTECRRHGIRCVEKKELVALLEQAPVKTEPAEEHMAAPAVEQMAAPAAPEAAPSPPATPGEQIGQGIRECSACVTYWFFK